MHGQDMKFKEMKLLISGRVQGVGFRHFTRTNAGELGLKGWVRNLNSGEVEALLQGPEKKLSEMIEKLKNGPLPARVDHIEVVSESDNPGDIEDNFKVVR
jgi:acylphosphatase